MGQELEILRSLLSDIDSRIYSREGRACQAYIRSKQCRKTGNCKHVGPKIDSNFRVCKVAAVGLDENQSMSCCDQKASICPIFKIKNTVENLKANFDNFSSKEKVLRWPSLAELYWIRGELREKIQTFESKRTQDGTSKESSDE